MANDRDRRAKILPHVHYEIEHCYCVPKHDQNDVHIRESVHLARLIHARVLIEFFGDTKKRFPEDVRCSDFKLLKKPKLDKEAKDAKDRIDKDICHLTEDRLNRTPATKNWRIDKVLKALRPTVIEFIDCVLGSQPAIAEPDQLDDWRKLRNEIDKNEDDCLREWSGYTAKNTANTSSTTSSSLWEPPR